MFLMDFKWIFTLLKFGLFSLSQLSPHMRCGHTVAVLNLFQLDFEFILTELERLFALSQLSPHMRCEHTQCVILW